MSAKGVIRDFTGDVDITLGQEIVILNESVVMTRKAGFTLAVWLHSSAPGLSTQFKVRLTKLIDAMTDDGLTPAVVDETSYPIANMQGSDQEFIIITTNDIESGYYDTLKIEIHNEGSTASEDSTMSYNVKLLALNIR